MFSAKADSVVKKTGQSNMFRMTSGPDMDMFVS